MVTLTDAEFQAVLQTAGPCPEPLAAADLRAHPDVRGQSLRLLAIRWGWSKSRVARFMGQQRDTQRDTEVAAPAVVAASSGTERGTVAGQRVRNLPPCSPPAPRSQTTLPVESSQLLGSAKTHPPTPPTTPPIIPPASPSPSRNGRATWLSPFGEAWQDAYGGEPQYGVLAKALAKLVKQHGPDKLLPYWRHYLAETPARFANPHRFAATWQTWAGGETQQWSAYSVEALMSDEDYEHYYGAPKPQPGEARHARA